jgi:hypothetical protein
LTESRVAPPAIANREERRNGARKRRLPLALIVVPVVLVGLGVALILIVSGGGGGGILGGDNGDEEAPPFDFRVGRVTVERTVADADVAALESQAQAVVEEITPVIDELFTDAYLDPANWRAGDYDEVFELFTNGAGATARTGVETVTLGASAGDVFEDVTPRRGGVDYTVLFDRENEPHTVVARVRFYATGERKDGTYLAIVSAGQLFLRDLDGWKVIGFDLRRNDNEAPPPTPAPSGVSPSATGATG